MVGLLASTRTTSAPEDDTEWPKVDVRNLIIDLDADIKADTMMANREKTEPGPTVQPSSRPHLPVGGAPSRPALARPLPHPAPAPMSGPAPPPPPPSSFGKQQQQPPTGSSNSHGPVPTDSSSAESDKSLKMKIKRTKSGQLKTEGGQLGVTNGDSEGVHSPDPRPHQDQDTPEMNGVAPTNNSTPATHNSSRLKVDAGTVTDASTVTEPEQLGPCEPGTSVSLEGIVWHETDSGVLVVNITWRGKTYVGTLLDCARHTNQWSAPRFTDSPEPGSKGRTKRNRTSLTPAELEPRKNLRSSKAKGKGKNGKNNGSDEFNFPAPSSPAKDSGKRKGRPDDVEDGKKRKRTGSESEGDNSGDGGNEGEDQCDEVSAEAVTQEPKRREPKAVVYSYKMLECPRKDCSKQYKHEEGLRWHLSHSHPEYIDTNGEIKDAATVEREEQERRRRARLLKEERRRETKEGGEGGAKDRTQTPPSKLPKLDSDKARTDNCGSPKLTSKAAPATSAAPAPARPSTNGVLGPAVSAPGQGPPPGLVPTPQAAKAGPAPAPPPGSTRLPGQLPAGLIAPNMKAGVRPGEVAPLLDDLKKLQETGAARLPSLDPDKPPANSPAYSDISDDGEDSRAKEAAEAVPKAGSGAPLKAAAAPEGSLPLSRPGPPPFTSPSVGPSPGTPEYHKYLAANGFPPFPYPYPVGMDPNYHVQLLKTDPVYKAKWEKDRAERERAFKEELDKDQGRYSGLSLLKEDGKAGGGLPSTPVRRPDTSARLPEDLRKREPSGDRSKTAPSPIISVKAEFREREEAVKKEAVKMEEGVKPTMETRGPPPGPQTFGYMHPGMVRPPFSSLAGLPPPFDPILTSSLAPFGLPGAPNPYLSSIRPPAGAFSFPGDPLRSPFPSLPSPEELVRAGAGAGAGLPGGVSGTKALDLLQQHASQYYANQKLAELQERALKSPSQSLAPASLSSLSAVSPAVSKSITTVAGKESPTPVTSSAGDKSKSPPPLRHVHTHTHTHIGLGYPLLPPVPGALPPVPAGLPPGALPPPTVGVVPASFTGSYSGKSP